MDHVALELRAAFQADGNTLVGHAAVFGSYARVRTNAGQHLETIAPGAFDRALAQDHDVRLTVGHNQNAPLARTTAGTLRLREDNVGLAFDADLPDTSFGRDVRTMVQRGDLAHMSIAFEEAGHKWSLRDGHRVQTVTDLVLHDVSLVGLPAYKGTDVRLRAFDAYPAPALPKRLILARARFTLSRGA